MYGGHTSKFEDVTTGVCCNIVLQFTNSVSHIGDSSAKVVQPLKEQWCLL